MQDLSNVTFNIPVRYDTPHRKENVDLILEYLNSNFKTNIILCEEDKEKHFDYVTGCEYVFIHSNNEYFHRTKLLNIMAKMSKTPIIVNYDCDVFLDPNNYMLSALSITENKLDMCFPYGGPFYDMSRRYIDTLKNEKNTKRIPIADCGLMHPNSVGGAIFWNKNKFIRMGMENENFLGWGFEDTERVLRAEKLGLKIGRQFGVLLHLTHDRLINSNPHHAHYDNNFKEYNKIQHMSIDQLRQYVSSWSWVK